MEELILRYYLRIISILIIFFSLYFSYLFFIKEIKLENNYIIIKKNQNSKSIINANIINLNLIEKFLLENYLSTHSKFLNKIHYGRFVLSEKINLKNFILIITKPSNFIDKITIVEGWSTYELNKLLKSKFLKYDNIDYLDIFADTYFLHSYEDFDAFYSKLINSKEVTIKRYDKNELLKKFSFDELIIIGSLLEKEGIDYIDKKIIFSVIKNRLQKNMKLQIDATTIYAVTDGKYDLDRELNFQDLKVKHPYNTYFIKGLPPKPISYVGKKTIELIFENYKSRYLYYFYDNIVEKHIYSETFKEHKRKLSEYRNKK